MPEAHDGNGHRIVAGVDGSPSSLEALRWAVRQAELTGSTVDAVMAWQPPAASGLAWGVSVDDLTDYGDLTAKLLVVGSRGRGGFASALLGSVSQHVTYHARCPVVVIREPAVA